MPGETTQFKPGQIANPQGRRPTKIAKRDLPAISKLAARGVREGDISRWLGVSGPTWQRIKRDQQEVQDALDAGRQKMHDALIGKLYERAMAGETVPLLFILKARFGYREGDELGGSAQPQITINLPGAVPLAQYVERVHDALPVPTPATNKDDD